MKKLFLHIGLHKTGTTTLQNFLNQNRDNLYNCGYLYPKTGIPEKYDAQHNLGWLTINSKQASSVFGNWKKTHQEIENSNLSNIIISSESFALANQENINNLKSELSLYEVKIIVYLRRQDLILESTYIQHLKMGIHSKKNLNNILSFLDKIRHRLDYYQLLEPWKQEFGIKNLVVRPLEKAQVPNICHDFLRQIDINDFDNFLSIKNRNIKPGIKALEILKLLNTIYEYKPQELKRKYLNKITYFTSKQWLDERNYRLLPYSESSKILKFYEQSNEAVAKEYLGREDGILFDEQLEPYENQKFDIRDLIKEEVLGLIKAIESIEEFKANKEELSSLIKALSARTIQKNNLSSINTEQVKVDKYINQEKEQKQQENIAQSLESYKRATELNPNSAPAWSKLAAIYEEQKNWVESTKCHQKIISLKPKNHAAYCKLAKVLAKQNKFYGAIAAYQEAIALKPDVPAMVYKNLGDLLVKEKDEIGDAIAAYRKAAELNSEWKAGFYIKYADMLAKKEQLDEAISNYQKAIELQPDLAGVYKKLGDVFVKKEQFDTAINCYQKALEINPKATKIYRFMGNILTKQGKIEK